MKPEKQLFSNPSCDYSIIDILTGIDISKSSPTLPDNSCNDPSASWSAQDQTSAYKTHRFMGSRVERASLTSIKTPALSKPTTGTHTSSSWSTHDKTYAH